MSFFKRQYTAVWRLFNERLRNIFLISLTAFLLLSVFFYFNCPYDAALEFIYEFEEQMADNGLINSDGFALALGLFINNASSSLFMMAYGLVPFIFLPVSGIIVNAFSIGAILYISSIGGTVSAADLVLYGILPHGIIEIPAFLLAISMGIYICLFICGKIIGKNKEQRFQDVFLECIRAYIYVVIPMLILAALIEAFITPELLGLLV